MEKKIKFRYIDEKNNEIRLLDCDYSDEYFTQSSYEYNKKLALLSAYTAVSACGNLMDAMSYEEYDKNIRYFMNEMEFEHKRANVMFNQKPSIDSIGCFFASKKIEDYTVIAIAIRGSGYEAEWASNFTIGEKGHHRGFSEARDIILSDLKKYLLDYDIKGRVKLWITGYSRAAGTANLLAGELVKNVNCFNKNITLKASDIYTYTIASPAGALLEDDIKNEIYHNIFNIVNPLDIVTHILPENMGFKRFGKDILLPELLIEDKKLYSDIMNEYQKIASEEYTLTGYLTVGGFVIRQLELVNEIEKILSKIDRKVYVEVLQNYSREVFALEELNDSFKMVLNHIRDYFLSGEIVFNKQELFYLSILNDYMDQIDVAHNFELYIAYLRLENI